MHDIKSFRRATIIAFLFNGSASLAMLFLIRPGLGLDGHFEAQTAYLRDFYWLWVFGWLVWIAAAVALIYFFVAWGFFVDAPSSRPLIVFGVLLAAMGLVPDTIADVMYIAVIPKWAALQNIPTEAGGTFVHQMTAWARLSELLTGFLGNGLYSVGGLVLNIVTLQSATVSKSWAKGGLVVWFLGLALSVVTLLKYKMAMVIVTGALMTAFLLWLFCLAFLMKGKK